jgi:hypothetical protein
VKPSAEVDVLKVERTDALPLRLVGVDEDGRKYLLRREEEPAKAVYGLPLPAVEDQPSCPSDHLHVSARITLGSCQHPASREH